MVDDGGAEEFDDGAVSMNSMTSSEARVKIANDKILEDDGVVFCNFSFFFL